MTREQAERKAQGYNNMAKTRLGAASLHYTAINLPTEKRPDNYGVGQFYRGDFVGVAHA